MVDSQYNINELQHVPYTKKIELTAEGKMFIEGLVRRKVNI